MEESKKKKWYAKIKNNFLRALISPFCVCFDHKVESFIWLMFVIVAGQLGTIINVSKRWVFGDWDICASLGPDTASGSFYTFALVLIASLIGPIFIRFIKKEEPEYRSISAVYLTLLVFSLILCAVFYSFSTNDFNSIDYSQLKDENMPIDGKQLFFFLLSIVLAWYSFGLTHLYLHEEELKLDDYLEAENNTCNVLSSQVSANIGVQPSPNLGNNNNAATPSVTTTTSSNANFENLTV